MSPACSRRRRRRLGRRGATSIEFALISIAFLTLLIGAMDLGRYFLIEHSLRSVVSEALRAALADTTLSGCSAPWTKVGAITPMLDPSLITLCVTQNPNTYGKITVTVNVSYTFASISPMLASLNGTISDATVVSY